MTEVKITAKDAAIDYLEAAVGAAQADDAELAIEQVNAAVYALHAMRLLEPTAKPVSELIREGTVCGTCADEGERACNCYAMLEEGR